MARTDIDIDDEACAAFMLETHTVEAPDQAGLARAAARSPGRLLIPMQSRRKNTLMQ